MGNLEFAGDNALKNLPLERKIYFISGLGADERVFQFLDLPGYQGIPVVWEKPLPGESLSGYAARLLTQIDTQRRVILIGVSFGGIIAQEIAKLVSCEKIILISSVKAVTELPWTMQLVKFTRLYRLFPPPVLKWLNLLTAGYYFGTETQAEARLLRAIIQDTNNDFMQWAIARIMDWQPENSYAAMLLCCTFTGQGTGFFPSERFRMQLP